MVDMTGQPVKQQLHNFWQPAHDGDERRDFGACWNQVPPQCKEWVKQHLDPITQDELEELRRYCWGKHESYWVRAFSALKYYHTRREDMYRLAGLKPN